VMLGHLRARERRKKRTRVSEGLFDSMGGEISPHPMAKNVPEEPFVGNTLRERRKEAGQSVSHWGA